MKNFRPFACDVCGTPVELIVGPGRTREYRRGVVLPIPDSFGIPTCPKCEETYFSAAEASKLARLQKPLFIEWQKDHIGKLLRAIRDANPGVTLRDIERASGVTGTYLSHLLAGRNEAGPTLMKLLEAFATHPAEFRRQLAGQSWKEVFLAGLRADRMNNEGCRLNNLLPMDPPEADKSIYVLVRSVLDSLAEYDKSGDHVKGHEGADCIRCKLLLALGRSPK
jgi:hypothetical protein